MDESNNSWLIENDHVSELATRDSLNNLSIYSNNLQIIIQKTDEYIRALEGLLEDKATPKREIMQLTNKLRELKLQESRIHEEARQIDEFLKSSGY